METTTVLAHPTRQGPWRGTGNIVGIIVHTSEGGEGPISAENLAAFTASPRTYNPDGTVANLASYHAIADTDKVILTVPDGGWAYAAGGGNRQFLHICIPGRVAQSREQWLDATSRAYIRQVAEYIVTKGMQYAIPMHKLSVSEMQAGKRGYAGHREVSHAYKQSNHIDPYATNTGSGNFPWDVLAADIDELSAPVQPPEPWPVFDPDKGKYSLYPFAGNKRDIEVFISDDVVRYAKGVMRDHAARFHSWFAAVDAYSWAWNEAHFIAPDTQQNHVANRRDLMNLAAHYCRRCDPNDPMFERDLFDAVVCTQAAWSGLTFDGFYCGVLPVDGKISWDNGMWRLIDSMADGTWG